MAKSQQSSSSRWNSSQPSTSQMVHSSQLNDTQLSASQMTQSKHLSNISPEEREKKVNDLVQYMLVMDQKKLPIKKRDINKIVLKDCMKAFNIVMEEASQRLLMVFGFKVVELADKLKGCYILVNTIENKLQETHLEWSEMETIKMGLVSVILSMIFMNGNVIQEDDLWHALKVLGIIKNENHSTFGDVKSLITEEYVKQGYLKITNQNSGETTVKEFSWGQRATHEFPKRNALVMVSELYQCEPSAWLHQWQEVQEQEKNEGEADANEAMEIS